MISFGVNPYVVDCNGNMEYNVQSLTLLSNNPSQKSIYFPVICFPSFSQFLPVPPWHYVNGVFPGLFNDVIGSGGEGIVIGGVLNGDKVAYKYVEIGQQKFKSNVAEGMADLATQLNEMVQMQTVSGSCILPLKGHFRFKCSIKLTLHFICSGNNSHSTIIRVWQPNWE